MAQRKKIARKSAKPSTRNGARNGAASLTVIRDADVDQIAQALDRVKNPTVRYFLSMMIDALTEDLAEIEAGRRPVMLTRSRSN